MTKTANVFFFQPSTRPFCGCCAVVNSYLSDTLEELGYRVQGVYGEGIWRPTPINSTAPLKPATRALQIRALETADLAVHCDSGLRLGGLRRESGKKHIVLFHGMGGGSIDLWAGNEIIDRLWGNSPYTRDVVRSMLAMPDLRRRKLLDPRAFELVSCIRLALSCLENPEGDLENGVAELPSNVRQAIDQGDVLGHCLVAEKVDATAVYCILLFLNQLALERGLGRKFRLFVDEAMFESAVGMMQLPPEQFPAQFLPLRNAFGQLGLSVEDILVPVPMLAQRALFELLRNCQFGLFYNVCAETFGFYPLESVVHGCPVYTNGVGNLRFLLPEGGGIHVYESEEMAAGDPLAYLPVARTIFRDTVEQPEATAERCRLGMEYIRRNYDRDALRHDIATELETLDRKPETVDFDSLVIRLSPLVRQWNPGSRRVLADHCQWELSPLERELIQTLLGRSSTEMEGLAGSELEFLEQLFQGGILTLGASAESTDDSLDSDPLAATPEPRDPYGSARSTDARPLH